MNQLECSRHRHGNVVGDLRVVANPIRSELRELNGFIEFWEILAGRLADFDNVVDGGDDNVAESFQVAGHDVGAGCAGRVHYT